MRALRGELANSADRETSIPAYAHRKVVVLVSAAPVDGYPPVQHQARLLAEHGFHVELITVPRVPGTREVSFTHPGVTTTVLPLRRGRGVQTFMRLAELTATLTGIRARYRRAQPIEIAYDPLAMLISDLAGFRPSLRVAHFHESLDALDKLWLEKRLRIAIRRYQEIVVADRGRAQLLVGQLSLGKLPHVVPNYPLRLQDKPPNAAKSKGFELIYSGSIGSGHRLDVIIKALCHCPEHVHLTILGDRDRPSVKALAKLAEGHALSGRVRFPGWVDYRQVTQRLSQAHLGVSLLDPHVPNFRFSMGASNKRYEYMRAGLAQIGDMNPGVPGLIEGNGIGRCVTSFEPEELAGLIRSYVDDPAACAEQGDRAYLLHLSEFNYENAFQPMLQCLTLAKCEEGVFHSTD